MPEYDSLNVHVGTLQKAEGLCTIRWIETHAVLCRERAGALTLRRGMAITLPHCTDHSDANGRSRNVELDPGRPYQRRGFARESQRTPPIRDDPRRDSHRDDFRGPAEPRDAEGDPGRGCAGGRRDGATRVSLGLRKRGDRRAVAVDLRGARGCEAVTRTRGTDGDEHGSRRRTREKELEPAHLIPAGQIFAFQPERRQPQRARQRRVRLERSRPGRKTARREGGAYL